MFQIPSLFSFYSLIYRLFRPENQREIYIAYYKERNFSEKFTYSEYTEFVRCNDSLYRSKYLRKCSILRWKNYTNFTIFVFRERGISRKKNCSYFILRITFALRFFFYLSCFLNQCEVWEEGISAILTCPFRSVTLFLNVSRQTLRFLPLLRSFISPPRSFDIGRGRVK